MDFPENECPVDEDEFNDRCRKLYLLLKSLWTSLNLDGSSRPGLAAILRIGFNDSVDQYNRACHPPHPKFTNKFDEF